MRGKKKICAERDLLFAVKTIYARKATLYARENTILLF